MIFPKDNTVLLIPENFTVYRSRWKPRVLQRMSLDRCRRWRSHGLHHSLLEKEQVLVLDDGGGGVDNVD
jgi:hypothetical protein